MKDGGVHTDPLLRGSEARRTQLAALFSGAGRIDLAELRAAAGPGASQAHVNKRFLLATTAAAGQSNARAQVASLWAARDAAEACGSAEARASAAAREASRAAVLAAARAEEDALAAAEDAVAAARSDIVQAPPAEPLLRAKRGRGGVGAEALDSSDLSDSDAGDKEAKRARRHARREARHARKARKAHKRE